jgi:hypothetical protein
MASNELPKDPIATEAVEIRLRPASSGSEGTQQPPPEDPGKAIVRVVQPIDSSPSHLGATLGEMSALANSIPYTVALAAYRDSEAFKAAVLNKWRDAEEGKDRFRDQYHAEARKTAVLEERQRGSAQLRRIQQVCLALGGVVGGTGLSSALAAHSVVGVGGVLLAIGLALLYVGSGLPLSRPEE